MLARRENGRCARAQLMVILLEITIRGPRSLWLRSEITRGVHEHNKRTLFSRGQEEDPIFLIACGDNKRHVQSPWTVILLKKHNKDILSVMIVRGDNKRRPWAQQTKYISIINRTRRRPVRCARAQIGLKAHASTTNKNSYQDDDKKTPFVMLARRENAWHAQAQGTVIIFYRTRRRPRLSCLCAEIMRGKREHYKREFF